MFNLPSLYFKLAGLALIVVLIGWHLSQDRNTEHKLEKTQAELITLKQELEIANENLIAITKSRDEYLDANKLAESQRDKIKADLQITLSKLNKQKPPTDCKAAIDWAIQNRADMEYEK